MLSRVPSLLGRRLFVFTALWFPLVILIISMTATLFVWHHVYQMTEGRAEPRFNNLTQDITHHIISRLQDNETVLLGVASENGKYSTLSRWQWP